MNRFVNLGHGNYIAAPRVVAVSSPDAAPIKRLIQDAKEEGIALDLTAGKRTRSVLIMDTGHVLLCALNTDTVSARLEGTDDGNTSPAAQETEETENE